MKAEIFKTKTETLNIWTTPTTGISGPRLKSRELQPASFLNKKHSCHSEGRSYFVRRTV